MTTIYYCLITFDPPLNEVDMEKHSFVNVEVQGTKETIEWFMGKLREDGLRGRIISVTDVSELPDLPQNRDY